jgi:exosortase A-associated hydrolase 2
MNVELRPRFVRGSAGDLFLLLYAPLRRGRAAYAVLCAPPFGEESNKARRMFHLQAISLAECGIPCAVLDLFGTGDSAGEFGDATWGQWLRDIDAARGFLSAEVAPEVACIGLRMGALLALEQARDSGRALQRIVLWHPWTDGGTELDNLLKTRVVADKFAGRSDCSLAGLKNELAAGRAVEVGGYEVSSALAADLAVRRIEPLLAGECSPTTWIDVGDSDSPAPARRASIEAARAGASADVHVVVGERFWSTAEITTCPSLVALTTELLAA